MVKVLSQSDKDAIAEAIKNAEQKTSAELVCVVSAASDAYQSYVFLFGFLTGSIIDLGLWIGKIITPYPLLLTVQIATISLFALIPFLRHLCVRLVPKRIRHRRAAHRAYEEYLIVSRHVSSATPIVLLYVSLAERYAHILPSRAVREKIPDATWNTIVQTLTASAASIGVRNACISAISQAAELLTAKFPKV